VNTQLQKKETERGRPSELEGFWPQIPGADRGYDQKGRGNFEAGIVFHSERGTQARLGFAFPGKPEIIRPTKQAAMKTRLTFITMLSTALALLAPSSAPAQAQRQANPPTASRGREAVMDKLEHIRFESVAYDGLPLGEVIRMLRDETKKRDLEKKGINFILVLSAESEGPAPAPAPGEAPHEAVDPASILVRISPPLNDVRLVDVLDAVVKVADAPIKYSIEDYGVVFSLRREPPRHAEGGFTFPGGTPNQFLDAVQQQYKVDWVSVADIPQEMVDVRIPRLRITGESPDPFSPRARVEIEPLAALVSLYNQLGEQKPELGHLLVKGALNRPSVVMFVPDKAAADARPKITVKAFSIYGINDAEKVKLQQDIDRAGEQALRYAMALPNFSGGRNLQGSVSIHDETSLLVATGPQPFVDMVESIVTAWQAKEQARKLTPSAPGR